MTSWIRRQPNRGLRTRRAALQLESLESRALLATDVFVDASNLTGVADGTALHPYTTLQAAVTAAAPNDVIKVARGNYTENVVIPDISLEVRGGFAGGTSAAYAAGEPGDFAAANPINNVTRITGDMDAPVLYLQNLTAKTVVIDGLVISGGLHGIYCVADYLQYADVTISNNVIENNGPASLQDGSGEFAAIGGGIYSSNATVTVTKNIIRNNNANRGGGLAVASSTDFIITDNLIENNSGYDDHGGGIVLVQLPKSAAGDGTFAHNIVRGNVAAKAYDYGWGGGILIAGNLNPASLKPITLSYNTYTENSAPSLGGAIFVDDGARVVLDHELIYKNSTDSAGGGGIYVDGDDGGVGSSLTIKHCTIADNTSVQPDGNGVSVTGFSNVVVSNSIFWGNTDDFIRDNTSNITVKYTNSQEAWPGTGNLQTDPLFANPAQGDYHLRSTAGRFDPAAQGGAGGWVIDSVDSPAIDAGDPAEEFASEPGYNGGRLNLGVHGNTPQASKSVYTGTDTTTELSSSIVPSVFGARVTFTATVRMAAASTARLSGRVHFMDGANEIGTSLLDVSRGISRARFSTSTLSAGSHVITAVFEGNTRFGPSTSAPMQQIVNQATTKTKVTLSPRAVVSGQTMNVIVRVIALRPGAGMPTGTVIFRDGATEIGRANLVATSSGARATLPISNLSVGSHEFTASYEGDANYVSSATTLPRVGTVRLAATKTTLTSSATTVNVGQPITFTAIVAVLPPGTGTPTGTVTFREGKTVLATATLQMVDGRVVATVEISTLSIGRHWISAVYEGDERFKTSALATLLAQVTE